jgi:subtilase family serine protease
MVAGCAVGAAASIAFAVPGIASATSTTRLPGSAPSLPAEARIGPAPASERLTIQVWLKPDLAGATAFADAVSTPGTPQFHHYLSPDAYTARFGPSAVQARAVTAWLTSQGLTGVRASSGRDYVTATGPVSTIQSVLQVRISRYRVTGRGKPLIIQAAGRAPAIPASLVPGVLGVTGLDSAPPVTAPPAAKAPACSGYWGQHVRSFHPAYRGLTKGSLPACGYSARQIRAAYGATMTATGKGQTIAVIEDEAPVAMFQTLTDYARAGHLPAPKPAQFREVRAGGKGTCGGLSPEVAQGGPDEPQLDSEALYAMAPGADQRMVIGENCNENQALLDAALSVLTGNGARPSASIESNSWQLPLGQVPAKTVHAIDLRAAAEGVGMYFAAGDGPGLNVTDSDPDAIVVGGTTLGIGARDNRLIETGWSNDFASLSGGKWTDIGIGAGTGGGTSLVYRQPAYQKGVVPASMSRVRVGKRTLTDRAVPDIAADADPETGILTGYIASKGQPYQTEVGAGTSLATPLIAGLVADAQQGQKSAFGFINPLIYHLAGSRAFHDILPVTASMPQQDRDAYLPSTGPLNPPSVNVFDSQEHAYTHQVTARGYDTMTGVGTPDGAAFISALRHAARA